MNGILNIYKEKGYTSHDVVAKLRGILKMKKIGHTGTLDPDACGVLPVCVGSATKVCELLTDKRKTYETTLLLGVETDTQDITGTVLKKQDVTVGEEELTLILSGFTGEQEQIPPMYSACKVQGKRLYELAREGKVVERKSRKITVYELTVLRMELPYVDLRITCSKGTYIRTLCHDIGNACGCGGCMNRLLRTRVDQFTLEEAKKLSQIEEAVRQGTIGELLYPVDGLFSHLPAAMILADYQKYLENGNPLKREWLKNLSKEAKDDLRLYREDGDFIGIYHYDTEKNRYRQVKRF